MDVVVRGRGGRVSAQTKERMEEKLGRLSRLDARINRIDVAVTFEPSERIGGGHRIEASCRSGRQTYRAHADGSDVDMALDRVVERLERQISDNHRKKVNRAHGTLGRVQSAQMGPNEGEPPALT